MSIAVVEGAGGGAVGGTTLAGVVVNPTTGEVFEASLGGGARLDGRDLAVNADVHLASALIGTGFGYAAERRREQAVVLLELLPKARDIRRIGSAALDLCAIAAGRLDAYYEWGLNAWDHSAGALVAREAGARVGGPHGGPRGHRAARRRTAGIYEELAAALREAGVDALARRGIRELVRMSRWVPVPMTTRGDDHDPPARSRPSLRGLRDQQGLEVSFSVGFTVTNQVKDAIGLLPKTAWRSRSIRTGNPAASTSPGCRSPRSQS